MIKGVPPLPPTHPDPVDLGPQGSPKSTKKHCKKGRAKMEARSQKIRGLNLNPLAPARSKRTFAFSGKTPKIMRNASISAPFFASFLHLFRDFSGKAEKGVQGPAPGPIFFSKWTSRAPKRSPRISNLRPKVPPSTNSHGRVLAEGDVDPAAGSRKEHFRL